MVNHHGDPFQHYVADIEIRIAREGVDGLKERDLVILQLGYQRRILHLLASPFWANWRPRDVAAAILMALTGLGVITSGAVTMAMKLLGN